MIIKEELISRILEIEWRMFENVSNIGGRAVCQEDPKTFEIMRLSQTMAWSESALESYLIDLREAEKVGRNLMTEKYARMMESTSPSEYARIKHKIPPLSPETALLIDKITKISLEWESELSERFPHLHKRGRPTYSSEDTPFVTSFETYLRGELSTYSQRTLQLYYDNILRQKAENINGSEIILDNMVKRYGYSSLEEANEKLKPI